MLRTGTAHHEGVAAQARGARIEPRGPRPGGLPVMVGAGGPRMLRLAAELADHWNGGLRGPAEPEGLLRAVDEACRAVGRDPATLTRSVEVLVRTLPAGPDEPLEERELRGTPIEIAELLRAFGRLGIEELQVQLRPSTLEAVHAFRPVIEAVHA